MESRLPDINTDFNMNKKKFQTAMDMKDYTAVRGALDTINGLLPGEPINYRITIDDKLYAEKTKTNVFIICKTCKKTYKDTPEKAEHDYNTIRFLTLLNSSMERLVSGRKERKIWECPICHNENTEPFEMIQTTLQEPFFLGVIPHPPKKGFGLTNRSTYGERFEKWAWQFYRELGERMAQYRDDNWERSDPTAIKDQHDITANLEEEAIP